MGPNPRRSNHLHLLRHFHCPVAYRGKVRNACQSVNKTWMSLDCILLDKEWHKSTRGSLGIACKVQLTLPQPLQRVGVFIRKSSFRLEVKICHFNPPEMFPNISCIDCKPFTLLKISFYQSLYSYNFWFTNTYCGFAVKSGL